MKSGCWRVFFRVLMTASVFLVVVFLLFQARTQPVTYGQLQLLDDDNNSVLDLRFVQSSCDVGAQSHLKMHELCRCPRSDRPLHVTVTDGRVSMSACSDHATARGPNQKLIVYAFYGSVDSKYFNGTAMNVESVAHMYPGWVIRVYHNLSMDNKVEVDTLCDLWCENDHLDLCNVRQLPPELCDQHKVFGMLWRFFPLGDPLVERFSVRDIDSIILQREVDSVKAWIDEGKTWHVMRDNPQHGTEILGGMWGGMNRDLSKNVALRNEFMAQGMKWAKGHDQHLLSKILWPVAQNDMTSHDSYLCKKYKGANPWPTKRIGTPFVGDAFPWVYDSHNVSVCPVACRPKDHQDWTHC